MRHILAVDMGGTNCRFGHFTLSSGLLTLRQAFVCATAEVTDAGTALRLASQTGLEPSLAHAQVWAVAGGHVVDSQCVRLTNADLCLDFHQAAEHTAPHSLRIINDFAAQAWACLTLPGEEAQTVARGCPQAQGVRAVLGAGTGLGAAALVYASAGWTVLPSEAGHVDFAFHGEEEEAFAAFVRERTGDMRVSAEHVLSGRGLVVLHQFVTGKVCQPWQAAAGLVNADGSESHTGQMFARFLGRFCRHWAISTLCAGGLYVSGGIAAKNPGVLRSQAFMDELCQGPPHLQDFLQQLPVRLMEHPHTGLWGAARAAMQYLEHEKPDQARSPV